MAEINDQKALLPQHSYEQEAKTTKDHQLDVELAKSPQDQSMIEEKIANLEIGLAYKADSSGPFWDDPTLDVQVLFKSFNKRFFCDKLSTVRVSWTKKLITRAGFYTLPVIEEDPRTIFLNEPLLKLRPRKDLVETLLHEMIHAYLFITNDDDVRKGHGPKFHEHMNRINKEAGTNITVYHDFHKEVDLLWKHWWRCDGTCRKRGPKFGMVHRSQMEAPGPVDIWWAKHSRKCGGTFVKICESKLQRTQMKRTQRESAKKKVKPDKDICKHIPMKEQKIPIMNASKSTINVHSSGNFRSNTVTVIPKANIGFPNSNGSTSGVSDKNNFSSRSDEIRFRLNCINDINDDLIVRDIWMKAFDSLSTPFTPVIISFFDPTVWVFDMPRGQFEISEMADCLDCLRRMPPTIFNVDFEMMKFKNQAGKWSCSICDKEILPEEYDVHVKEWLKKIKEEIDRKERMKCSSCGWIIRKSESSSHLDSCNVSFQVFPNHVVMVKEKDVGKEAKYCCLWCLLVVTEEEMSAHIDFCEEKIIVPHIDVCEEKIVVSHVDVCEDEMIYLTEEKIIGPGIEICEEKIFMPLIDVCEGKIIYLCEEKINALHNEDTSFFCVS